MEKQKYEPTQEQLDAAEKIKQIDKEYGTNFFEGINFNHYSLLPENKRLERKIEELTHLFSSPLFRQVSKILKLSEGNVDLTFDVGYIVNEDNTQGLCYKNRITALAKEIIKQENLENKEFSDRVGDKKISPKKKNSIIKGDLDNFKKIALQTIDLLNSLDIGGNATPQEIKDILDKQTEVAEKENWKAVK